MKWMETATLFLNYCQLSIVADKWTGFCGIWLSVVLLFCFFAEDVDVNVHIFRDSGQVIWSSDDLWRVNPGNRSTENKGKGGKEQKGIDVKFRDCQGLVSISVFFIFLRFTVRIALFWICVLFKTAKLVINCRNDGCLFALSPPNGLIPFTFTLAIRIRVISHFPLGSQLITGSLGVKWNGPCHRFLSWFAIINQNATFSRQDTRALSLLFVLPWLGGWLLLLKLD